MTLRILHVAPSFWPATFWGGPIFSTKAICDGLYDHADISLKVLTTDSAGPRPGDRVHISDPMSLGYKVHRARRLLGASVAPGLLPSLLREIRISDVIHLTGTYSFPTLPTLFLARLTGTPVLWSPRGAIQATAGWESAPRRRIKRAFERLADFLRPQRTILHVTSEDERRASVQSIPGMDARVVPNSVEVPDEIPTRTWRPDGVLRLMFLSRIHSKKGLEALIDAMQSLPAWVRLDIYGDGEPGYIGELMAKTDADDRIVFRGPAEEVAKRAGFAEADLFVLPSWSENFGIVVAEALANGVPVLTTNRTPWRDVEHQDCGRCYDPDENDLADEILTLAGRDLETMGQRGREWMRRDFSQSAMCDALADLYFELAGQQAAVAA